MNWIFNGEEVTVRIQESRTLNTIHVNDQATTFRILERTEHGAVIDIQGQAHRVFAARDRDGCTVWWEGRTYRLQNPDNPTAVHAAAAGGGEVRAVMPGKILRVDVLAGATVEEKQPLLTMESMKMETTLYAHASGRVKEVHVRAGDVVDIGKVLLQIE